MTSQYFDMEQCKKDGHKAFARRGVNEPEMFRVTILDGPNAFNHYAIKEDDTGRFDSLHCTNLRNLPRETNTTRLEACPGCGKLESLRVHCATIGEYRVECARCGYRAPFSTTKHDAVVRHNDMSFDQVKSRLWSSLMVSMHADGDMTIKAVPRELSEQIDVLCKYHNKHKTQKDGQ